MSKVTTARTYEAMDEQEQSSAEQWHGEGPAPSKRVVFHDPDPVPAAATKPRPRLNLNPRTLRDAIVLSEIVGPPVSKRRYI